MRKRARDGVGEAERDIMMVRERDRDGQDKDVGPEET